MMLCYIDCVNYRIGKYRIRELLVVGICTASNFKFLSLTYVDGKSRKRTEGSPTRQ